MLLMNMRADINCQLIVVAWEMGQSIGSFQGDLLEEKMLLINLIKGRGCFELLMNECTYVLKEWD